MITGAVIGFMLWCLVVLLGININSTNFNYPKTFLALLVMSGFLGGVGYLFS